mgnify:CR=1 FL=1
MPMLTADTPAIKAKGLTPSWMGKIAFTPSLKSLGTVVMRPSLVENTDCVLFSIGLALFQLLVISATLCYYGASKIVLADIEAVRQT